ncbi:tRNA lysidine(34) synthetase TilS [Luteimonas sp. BDR2-5]|uniref:tRNA lysidine(34) synthetase TilS n=1 Tax=Proluteimonas luteida TaxID=2878685 RepID=UPI001E630529|nr:tRNA lysidine(34) synthetase TilS [Luteimonas sp. BDR2-5]MCD9028106.1 tRNA lysidine(34) synthetase TilS [Luteimonas sp. BDR2-5]
MRPASPPTDLVLPPPPATGPLLVGFSGGLDSTVLLHRLARDSALRAHGLRALHVHHGLQPAADAWAAHCREVCAMLDVPLDVATVTVARDSALGPEGAARVARHAAFADALQAGGILVLAHHQGDQAETFLLRALRGAGPDGLAAMRPVRPFARGLLWRPLLGLPRAALADYARAHALAWIEDPSNAGDDPDRNFLRNRVLPLLRTRWPHAGAAFATAAALQADAVDLLTPDDADALAQARSADPRVLRIAALAALAPARRARVLRRWIHECGLAPLPAAGIAWCAAEVAAPASDRNPRFDWHGCRLQRWRGLLHADVVRAPLDAGFHAEWSGASPLPLPGGGLLALDGAPVTSAPWPLTVRARRGGERIVLPGRRHSHALKHVLQSLAVPPWLRAQLPLLSDGDGRVLAAGDLVHDAGFDAWLRDSGAVLRWQPPGDGGVG